MGRKYQRYIHLRLQTEGNRILSFKLKTRKPILKNLNQCIENLSGYPPSLFRFIYDGMQITATATPRNLNMKKGDIIECYEMRDGG